jgi:hypothetical protein
VEKKMKISLALLETNSEINKSILSGIADHMRETMVKSQPSILEDIRGLIRDALKQEPEYSSLTSGKLRAELGIPNPSIVDSIVNKIADTVTISMNPVRATNRGVLGGFTLTAISSLDIGGLIGDPDAFVQDSLNGYSLPWLEWLMLRGTSEIVKNYTVDMTSNPNSRSGMALMVTDTNSWRVPSEFAGVAENNWSTRAIERIEKNIPTTIQTHIEKNL